MARAQGPRVEEPVVVRDLTNVLVRLDPSPVVARVPLTLSRLRGRDWFEIEIRVASFLAAAGAPVAPPTPAVDPGPHSHDGLLVTLWQLVPHDPDRFDAGEVERTLRELHSVLVHYPGELPPCQRLDEVARLLDALEPSAAASASDLRGLRAVHGRLARALPETPMRPLHGDSHFGNVLWTPHGPLWSDLENVCAGPVEYDLACLTWRDGAGTDPALEAYGPTTASCSRR